MTRTTPDRAFAEAARTELLRQARDSRASTRISPDRSRGLWRQIAITVAVAALICGALAGTGLLRSVLTPPPPAASPPSDSRVTDDPAPTAGRRLIAPSGYQARTDAELRAWGRTLPDSSGSDRTVWLQQQILITHCMAEHGFLYDPIYHYEHAMSSLPAGHEEAYEEALTGSTTGTPNDWRGMGCTGFAQHRTGSDPVG